MEDLKNELYNILKTIKPYTIWDLCNHRTRLEKQLYSYIRNKECLANFLSRIPEDTPRCEEIIEARDSLERFNVLLSQYAYFIPYN